MHRNLFEDEHDQFRASVRRWVDDAIVPNHAEWEESGIVPRSLFADAGALGFVGMAIPEEYGGGGVDDFRYNQIFFRRDPEGRRGRVRDRDGLAQRHLRARTSFSTVPRSSGRAGYPVWLRVS